MMLCAHAAPYVVDFDDHQAELALSHKLQTLEDRDSRFNVGTLLAEPHTWGDHHSDTLNLGFSRSTWWVRVGLHNATATEATRVLDTGTPLQDEVDIYIVRAGNLVTQQVLTGDRRPFNTRPVLTRIPILPIRFGPGEQLDVYVRLATHDGLQEAVDLKLWQPKAHATHLQTSTMALGLYYGALCAVLLYNLFLFVSTRERGFGLYVVYVAAFVIWSFTFRGFAFQYWWPDAPVFNNQILPIAAAACYFTFGLFTIHYLDTRRNVPLWLHRTLVGATWGSGLCITPAFFNYYALSFAVSIPFGVVLMVTANVTGCLMTIRGSRPARYFLIAFTLLGLGVMLYYLRLLGAVPPNAVTENFLQLGSGLEVLLLAFGLAAQMNTLKADKLKAERDALAAQTALTNELESLVNLRTVALEAANQYLADLTITDALTGAYNRRHFNTLFESEVARHSRYRTPIAFCLLDIDNFKLYNDNYGHPAGDEVLKQVSQTVRSLLPRAGDLFFRVGGEEFAILLNMDDPFEKVQSFVEHIRAELEKLRIPHAASPYGVVTASFGLVLLSQDTPVISSADVYATADKLLYEAKHTGRNRVVTQVC
jgi:two-component system, sensor histidine kinase LadS